MGDADHCEEQGKSFQDQQKKLRCNEKGDKREKNKSKCSKADENKCRRNDDCIWDDTTEICADMSKDGPNNYFVIYEWDYTYLNGEKQEETYCYAEKSDGGAKG